LALLLILLALLVGLIQLGIIAYAYDRIGMRRTHAFLLLLLSFLGAYINIPIAHLPDRLGNAPVRTSLRLVYQLSLSPGRPQNPRPALEELRIRLVKTHRLRHSAVSV
jgi:hypothetical protein